jgi:uncharacterized protein with HEPN domain
VTRSDEERIEDIREACTEVGDLVSRGRDAFDEDRALPLALERLLEIIGEAANALDPATRTRYSAVAWTDVTKLRILLAHHYHRIDPDQVWAIASTHVPELLDQLTDR